MKIACHILSYNVDLFIDHVLENAAPHVDKIFITYSVKPWGYVPSSRATKTNPTTLARVHQAIARMRALTGLNTQVEVIEGEWATEEETRNACLDAATLQGFDWLIIQDADEFYTGHAWRTAKDHLFADQISQSVTSTWYLFWKSSHYVVEFRDSGIKSDNPGFALRCNSGARFVSGRRPDARTTSGIDAVCYHYGYVMSDDQMAEKVSTWGHAHQFDARKWLTYKWYNWTPHTRNLNPVSPVAWPRAFLFPNEQPDFARHFALPLLTKSHIDLADRMGALAWDLSSELRFAARDARRAISGRS